jgi:hypothetical protein
MLVLLRLLQLKPLASVLLMSAVSNESLNDAEVDKTGKLRSKKTRQVIILARRIIVSA